MPGTYVSVQPAYDVRRVINHKRRQGGGDEGRRGLVGEAVGEWNNIMTAGNCLIFLQRARRGIRKQTTVRHSKRRKGGRRGKRRRRPRLDPSPQLTSPNSTSGDQLHLKSERRLQNWAFHREYIFIHVFYLFIFSLCQVRLKNSRKKGFCFQKMLQTEKCREPLLEEMRKIM